MSNKGNKSAMGQKPSEIPDDSTARVRSEYLVINVVAEHQPTTVSPSASSPEVRKDSVSPLTEGLARRQKSYSRREQQYKLRIAELEALLCDSCAKQASKENAAMDRVRSLHRAILARVEHVQICTSERLQEQESDLVRALQAQVYSVQEELACERKRPDAGAAAWLERTKQLEIEVEWIQELAERLDRLNQSLSRENERLKTQFSMQENDREFLVTQLVTVKKNNASLRLEVASLRLQPHELDARQLQQQQLHPQLHALLPSVSTSCLPKARTRDAMAPVALAVPADVNIVPVSNSDARYKAVIQQLKQLLKVERRNLHHVRTAYKFELQSHFELETILRDCVKATREEIVHVSSSSSVGRKQQGEIQSENRLSTSERDRFVKKVMEQEQVLKLLTQMIFPDHNGKRHLGTGNRYAATLQSVAATLASRERGNK